MENGKVIEQAVSDLGFRKEFLYHTHGYVNEYVRFADGKAAAVIAWGGALIAFITSSETGVFRPGCTCGELFVATLGGGAVVVGIVYAMGVLKPNLRTSSKPNQPSLIFFVDVAEKYPSAVDYASSVMQLSQDDVDQEISRHVYDLSLIASLKFKNLNLAIAWMWVGSFISLILLILEVALVRYVLISS